MPTNCVFCRRMARSGVLAGLALLLLVLLWLLRAWLWLLLFAYLGLIVLAGIVALALVARRVLARVCWKREADPKGNGSRGRPSSGPVLVPAAIYKRPDPLLYSQAWMAARGLAVNWDNPDITVLRVPGPNLPPQPAQAHALAPNQPHLIRARIWNGSTEAPAVNLLVRFFYLTFGIGAHRERIGEMLLPDLPVKGAAGLPRVAEMPWTTPAAAGHYCLQVELVWTDDADQGNNVGQTNLDIKALNSPNATFTFPVRNDGLHPARLRMTVDAYRFPAPEDCGETAAGQPRDRLARHRPEANALPAGWSVDVAWRAEDVLAAGEERPVTVKVTAPDGFTGALDVNVNAFDRERLVGGVTLRVHS
jgi:hypothetical protein